MKLKKIFLLTAVLAVVSAFALTGCDGADTTTQSGVTASAATGTITGVWEMTKNTIGDEEIDISDMQSVYVFRDDGTFEMVLNGDSIGSGAYTVDGDTVTLDINGAATTLKLEGSKLITETETAEGLSVMVLERAQN